MPNFRTDHAPGLGMNYVTSLSFATLTAGMAGLAFGVSRHLDSGDALPWQASAVVTAAGAILLTTMAVKKWRRPRLDAQPGTVSPPKTSASELPAPPRMLALPAPPKPQAAKQQEEARREDAMPKTEKPASPDPSAAIETERARLRAAGYSDPEISQILVAREAAGTAPRGSFGSGIATGLLNNIAAVLMHARSLVPSFKADLERMFDRNADAPTRITSSASLALKTLGVVVLGYFLYLEALQLRSMAYKSWAEACIERQKNAINFMTMDQLMSGHGATDLDRECKS